MEWKELGSLVRRKIGYGIVQPGASVPNGVPVIKVNNIIAGLHDISALDTTTHEIADKYPRTKLNGGELVISVVGTYGKTAIVPTSFKGSNLVRATCLIDIDDEILTKWVKYYIDSPSGQNYILNNLNTTVQATLNVKDLNEMPIPLFPRNVICKIVSILSSLDRKIELNNKINAQLEEMAQAIFKSWFVDFEPFKDGNFIESELGMIPEGWRVGIYDNISRQYISGDWGKENNEGNYTHEVACVRGCDFADILNGVRGSTPTRYILEKNYQQKRLKHNDIIVEISGGTSTVSTGRVALVSNCLLEKYNDDIVCTNFCRIVRPIDNYSAYLYYSWLYKYDHKVMFGYENGTSGLKNFSLRDFVVKELVVIPPIDVSIRFQTIVDDLYKSIQTKGTENTHLASLRDTLLPKLMSGEIDLDNLPEIA